MTPICYCNCTTVILGDFFFAPHIILVVCGGKINIDPLPGKFVTVLVALNFLSIALMVDMGLFRQIAIFL